MCFLVTCLYQVFPEAYVSFHTMRSLFSYTYFIVLLYAKLNCVPDYKYTCYKQIWEKTKVTVNWQPDTSPPGSRGVRWSRSACASDPYSGEFTRRGVSLTLWTGSAETSWEPPRCAVSFLRTGGSASAAWPLSRRLWKLRTGCANRPCSPKETVMCSFLDLSINVFLKISITVFEKKFRQFW